jgi:hypothetical protein
MRGVIVAQGTLNPLVTERNRPHLPISVAEYKETSAQSFKLLLAGASPVGYTNFYGPFFYVVGSEILNLTKRVQIPHGLPFMRCEKHPKYKAIHKPRCNCETCWNIWYSKHHNIFFGRLPE